MTHEELLRILRYIPWTGKFHWAVPRPKVRVGAEAGYVDKKGYVVIELGGREYFAHRLAWFYQMGEWPPKQIDHIDRNKSNNVFSNLRIATNGQNQANAPHRNKTGFKGVNYHAWVRDRPYEAKITANKKVVYLGSYATAEEAHAAYCEAAKRIHGEFFHP